MEYFVFLMEAVADSLRASLGKASAARKAIGYDYRYRPVIEYLIYRRGYRLDSLDFFTLPDNISGVKSRAVYLFFAVKYHFIPEAMKLIKLGADVCIADINDQTALHVAVTNKSHVEPLQIIPNGTQYSRMDLYCLESFRFATAGRDEIRIRELAASRRQDLLHRSQRSIVKMLLDAGAKVNTKDNHGCSPLQYAIYTGDLELVTMLIDAGADLNSQNRIGATALHDAVLCCDEEMVFLLLSRGADVSIKTVDPEGDTALHWATVLNIGNNHDGIIRMFLEFRSELLYEMSAFLNRTPFNYILQCCDVNMVSLCIEMYKADLKKVDDNGNSALTFAVLNLKKNIFDFVLERAEIGIGYESHYGISPFMCASGASMLEYVRRLIYLGADVNAMDRRGSTALFYCIYLPYVAITARNHPLFLLRPNYAEERLRVMKLLLDYGSDVNQKISNNTQRSLLEMLIEVDDSEALNVMIEHVAETEVRSSKPLLNDYNLTVINRNPAIKSYYQTCQAELTAMKTAKIRGTTISYFSVLTEPLDVLARYARNYDFVRAYEASEYQTIYKIYALRLWEKFDTAIARQKTIKQSSAILSTILPFADSHPAIELILKSFSEKDLQLLIGRVFSKN